MNQPVLIAGVGMTPFGRHGHRSVKELSAEAVALALADAELEPSDIDAVVFANTSQGALEGQHSIRGQIAMRAMGIETVPVVNVEAACASGAITLHLATSYVRSGQADIVVAIGVEKLNVPDRARTLSFFESGWDVAAREANSSVLIEMTQGAPNGPDAGRPRSMFMDIYAAMARMHMRDFGLTQAQLARVAAKNHCHSVHNQLAHLRKPFSEAEVLASAPIAYPLTLYMCAPLSDGAAAAVVCSPQALSAGAHRRAAAVMACVAATGANREARDLERHITVRAAREAYRKAGLTPSEMSIAEVHDATAFGEIIQSENLGFCDRGQGGRLADDGATSLGGARPINLSGGLEGKGHPIAATGLAQIAELVTQLRGEAGARQADGVKYAIAENGGGLIGVEEAVACVTILGRA